MSEREQTLKRLVDDVGMSPRQAELVMRDDDLWLLEPESRWPWEGEDAVSQWHDARAFVMTLSEGFTAHGAGVVNDATVQLLRDLEERAEEALRRARARAYERREA